MRYVFFVGRHVCITGVLLQSLSCTRLYSNSVASEDFDEGDVMENMELDDVHACVHSTTCKWARSPRRC